MEILFLLISLIISFLMVWFIGRLVCDSTEQLIRLYKESDTLAIIHFMLGILLTTVLFVTLCACNNTFWHLPYYF